MRLLKRFAEFHERPGFPHSWRCMLTDVLSVFASRSGIYEPAFPLICDAAKTGDFKIVRDFCSGNGLFLRGLERCMKDRFQKPPAIVLCDKYPNTAAFYTHPQSAESLISYESEPVDALAPANRGPEFWTMFSATHHFEPEELKSIIATARSYRCGFGFFDYAVPDLGRCIFRLAFTLPMVWTMTAFLRPLGWRRMLLTYILPVIPFFIFIDGVISHLKGYTGRDLSKLVDGLADSGYTFSHGELSSCCKHARIAYLIGYPSPDAHGTGGGK